MLFRTYKEGRPPRKLDAFVEEEAEPSGKIMVAYGESSHVQIPEELGGGVVRIADRRTADRCPVCRQDVYVHLIETDQTGPDGGTLAVVCCMTEKLYGWVELDKKE